MLQSAVCQKPSKKIILKKRVRGGGIKYLYLLHFKSNFSLKCLQHLFFFSFKPLPRSFLKIVYKYMHYGYIQKQKLKLQTKW